MATEPFRLQPYPYDRLDDAKKLAQAHEGGLVDCSIGTPCDPPPESVINALSRSGTERGYPPSAGTLSLRVAASEWMTRRLGVDVDPESVAACVGTKEFVASTAQYLRLRDPSRDTVLYPAVSYPTYAMGAELGGCRAVAVPPATADGNGLDLAAVRPEDAERALLLWVNSPANPAGGLSDLGEAARFGAQNGVPVFSDECYLEFTWDGPPRSILQYATKGVVAVHSLSKRSNLAGVRVGFFAGDPEYVAFLRGIRQHAGLMVPGPAQSAATFALVDDEHVAVQRARYEQRRDYLAGALGDLGWSVPLPAGGFYLWAPVPDGYSDAWALTEDLARCGGILVSPGELYGEAGCGFVRIALVQPLERLELVVKRLHDSAVSFR